MGSVGQDNQGQFPVGDEQDDQGAREQNKGLDGHQQALAEEHAQFFHIVGGANHQLPGAVACRDS